MELILPPWFLFDVSDEDAVRKLLEGKDPVRARDRGVVLCRGCTHLVTYVREGISIQGSHTHRFSNPLGISFTIGCFQNASGCRASGATTLEWTWFDGYTWCYAVCRSCHGHLGWIYESAEGDIFFGLILKQLIIGDRG